MSTTTRSPATPTPIDPALVPDEATQGPPLITVNLDYGNGMGDRFTVEQDLDGPDASCNLVVYRVSTSGGVTTADRQDTGENNYAHALRLLADRVEAITTEGEDEDFVSPLAHMGTMGLSADEDRALAEGDDDEAVDLMGLHHGRNL
jgi:hypothetical protein